MCDSKSIDNVKLLSFSEIKDERGTLVVIEGRKTIPFDIKRMFYMYGTKADAIRGKHANKKSNFIIISLKGECDIVVIDQKNNRKTIHLSNPNQGVYIPTMIWKEMKNYSEDCVMMVLSDAHYDPDEYIKDFECFTNP